MIMFKSVGSLLSLARRQGSSLFTENTEQCRVKKRGLLPLPSCHICSPSSKTFLLPPMSYCVSNQLVYDHTSILVAFNNAETKIVKAKSRRLFGKGL